MRRLVYLASVRQDLLDILNYVAAESGSVAVAQEVITQLRGRCHAIASKPGTLGRARPELRTDIRSIAHKGYVIFFRYVEDRLEVVNILEGHRDIDAHFSETNVVAPE
ncbi:MAG: type II toxin-antitoxin system RelE/ParE family toxin [Alphaproteobacteria bacterium]|nr:type II toxin-antitoxin system RelE/ParE family toxin [Alphaproteobacteria bacterium]